MKVISNSNFKSRIYLAKTQKKNIKQYNNVEKQYNVTLLLNDAIAYSANI